MSQLIDLPSELLLQIFDDYDTEPEDLRDYCHISRRIRDVAQPCIYKWIDLKGRQDLLLERLWKFTRTVINRPDLAAIVMRMTIDLDGAVADLNFRNRVEETQLFQAAMPGVDKDFVPTTVGYAPLLAILGVRLPALKSLTFYVRKTLPDRLAHFIHKARRSDPQLSFFPALKFLVLNGPEDYFNFDDVLPLLTAPNLQVVVASRFYFPLDPDKVPLALMDGGVINATTLAFTNCAFNLATFESLIKACHDLKGLDYAPERFTAFNQNRPVLGLHELLRALPPCGNSLKRLCLSSVRMDRSPLVDAPEELTTLKDFHQLHSLSIQIDLWNELREKLPRALLALALTHSAKGFQADRDFFRDLFNAKDLYSSSLRIMIIQRSTVDAAKLIKQHALEHGNGYTVWHETEYGGHRDAVELLMSSSFVIELSEPYTESRVPIHSRTLKTALCGDVDPRHEVPKPVNVGGPTFDRATKLPILRCSCQDAEDILA